jgi:outer membrane receptor protein involved in Fe transport
MVKQMEITASWQKTTEGRNSRKRGSTILRKEKEQVNTLGLTADILSQPNKWWSANSGIELYRDKVNSSREDLNQVTFHSKNLRGLYPDRSTYGNYSLYSLQHFQFNQFVAELGGRFNVFDIRISDTTLGAVQLHPSTFVGNAALLYQLDRQQSIYTSVSSGYRAPNIDDMGTLGIVDFRYEIPTARLEPEQSIHTEIGYKFSHKKIKGSINLYRLQLRNIITRTKLEGQVINGYAVYQKENSERARIKGIEAEMSWQILQGLVIYGGCSYSQGDNLTKDEPLRRIPPFHGRGMSTYRTKKYFITGEWMFAARQARLASGDIDDNRIPAGGTPGWNIVNIYSGFTASRFQLQLGLQNLFNADYRTHGSGINGVGRSVFLSTVVNL